MLASELLDLRGRLHKQGVIFAYSGYVTEPVLSGVGEALKQKGIYRVWSVCDVDNVASARVMEKAGMKREGILRRWSMHPTISDKPRDSYCYSITK